MMNKKKVLVAYVPVLHQGYLQFFERHRGEVNGIFLLGADFIDELHPLHKEIRALDPERMRDVIASLDIFPNVSVLTKATIGSLPDGDMVTADEAISRKFLDRYLPNRSVTYSPVFLRWDEKNVKSDVKVACDRESTDPFDREMITRAEKNATRSADWWRHVGAVLVKEGKILDEGYNEHVPSDHDPYTHGDPRDVVAPGTEPELYTSIHVEQALVARAAKAGRAMDGASLYINIFPCPPCAKIIARAGVKKVFFRSGSAWLDAESVLKAHGIEIIHVP